MNSTIEDRPLFTPLTIRSLVEKQAELRPDAIAIKASGRSPLSYEVLFNHLLDVGSQLNRMGLGRDDRVALVLPNGPELAVAFLAVACFATAAPLNPAYGANEFAFYLKDLNAKALLIQSGLDSPARSIARDLDIPLIELTWSPEQPAGLFDLSGPSGSVPVNDKLCMEEDVALVLHTSGTTSRPKIVPLNHRNICTSALNIGKALDLTPSDLCLNVMPLFHIHGLIGATLSSIAAGAGIVCTSGFYAPDFFLWMDEFRPTWYTAVPTMHQAILSRVDTHAEIIRKNPLRFIRSSSSALAAQTLMELERAFGAPVIEAYGMTEASHQMATNPLPPSPRKPGSVGVAAGIEIAIMDEAGTLVPNGGTGEIVIRGRSVMSGYENNQSANKSAFTDGWLRTGDQGMLDSDNYLYITGRLKEIINRGGEKISPREVDEVLLEHPAVAQAVTFAVPHPELGDDVAAAIVLRERASVTEAELRSHAAQRLVYFKVPRQILLMDEIPKGATGKLQRIGLAEKLGVTALARIPVESQAEYVSPRTQLEEILAKLWSEILEVPRVGVKDHFFYLGGDSMLATRLISKLREAVQIELPLASIFEIPTLADMASELEYLIIEKFESSLDRK